MSKYKIEFDKDNDRFIIESGLSLQKKEDGSSIPIVVPFTKEDIEMDRIDLSDDYIDSWVDGLYKTMMEEGDFTEFQLVDLRNKGGTNE